jgi:hypothetical protein
MKFSIFQISRRGGRENNEDRMGYCYTRESGLFVLADGMGGHRGGEVASALALESLASLAESTTAALVNGITRANDAVYLRSSQDPELRGMGTTLIALALAVDADGQPLTGEHAYALHLDVPPPVDAFWSLTMYASPDYYLVDNPIDRYSIGDRTEGLVTDGDGSITIWMQATAPGGGRDANWLPTPPGPFRPILRLYQPRPEVLDGRWPLPPIQRLPETDGQG